MKVIAFYLPQFHNIPENDEWWGDGFTEWVNVRRARPLFEGHDQPKIPLDGRYYNLLDADVKRWQASIARQYGVYGFCYYHYWFDGRLLLERPMEQMLADETIDMPFCISWANEAWTKAWVGENKVLIAQRYGGKEEWKAHFDYLLPFFKDSRYIRIDDRPLLVIYRAAVIGCFSTMIDYWQELARQAGLEGLYVVTQRPKGEAGEDRAMRIERGINFQPFCAKADLDNERGAAWRAFRAMGKRANNAIERGFGIDVMRRVERLKQGGQLAMYDYDRVWGQVLSQDCTEDFPGAYVKWDNTPRKGENGSVDVGATPAKFGGYMKRLIENTKSEYGLDYLFLTAWNEWAEGSYIEPDESDGFGYLSALKTALDETAGGGLTHRPLAEATVQWAQAAPYRRRSRAVARRACSNVCAPHHGQLRTCNRGSYGA